MKKFLVYGYRVVTLASEPIEAESMEDAIRKFDAAVGGGCCEITGHEYEGIRFAQDAEAWESFGVVELASDPAPDSVDFDEVDGLWADYRGKADPDVNYKPCPLK